MFFTHLGTHIEISEIECEMSFPSIFHQIFSLHMNEVSKRLRHHGIKARWFRAHVETWTWKKNWKASIKVVRKEDPELVSQDLTNEDSRSGTHRIQICLLVCVRQVFVYFIFRRWYIESWILSNMVSKIAHLPYNA